MASSTQASASVGMSIPWLASLSLPTTGQSGREIVSTVRLPSSTEGTPLSDQLELTQTLVLVVRSNAEWRLVVRAVAPDSKTAVMIRAGDREYQTVQKSAVDLQETETVDLDGRSIAFGGPGVHEIVLDYRVAVGEAGWNAGDAVALVYAIERVEG